MKKKKKKNQRRCILTKIVQDKSNLIRIVSMKDGKFEVNSNKQGRGTYVSKDAKLVKKIKQNNVLHRSFKKNVPNEVYEKLIREIKGD